MVPPAPMESCEPDPERAMGIRTRGESWLPGQGNQRVGSLPVLGVEKTSPLVGFYASSGLLVGIDATGPVDDVTERALEALRRFEA